MDWNGYYINLDRSPDRRAAMEEQLGALGLEGRYRRFAAHDGRSGAFQDRRKHADISPAEIAIFKSHLDLLRQAAASRSLTHILEDDVLISRRCGPFIDSVARLGLYEGVDVIVTDTGIARDMTVYNAFKSLLGGQAQIAADRPIQIVDISSIYMFGMTSYIVAPSGAARLAAELEAAWNKGPNQPVDHVLHDAARAGRVSIGCSFPLLTWLKMENASRSLADRTDEAPVFALAMRLARYPFYVEGNANGFLIPSLKRLITEATAFGEQRLTPAGRDGLELARLLLADLTGQPSP